MPEAKPSAEPATFEEQLAALEQIVHELEEGQIGLEASLGRYQEGVTLLKQCQKIVREVEQKIEILTSIGPAGEAITEPFAEPSGTLAEKGETRTKRRSRPAARPAASDIDAEENLF